MMEPAVSIAMRADSPLSRTSTALQELFAGGYTVVACVASTYRAHNTSTDGRIKIEAAYA